MSDPSRSALLHVAHENLRRSLLQVAREPGLVQHKLDAAELAYALGEAPIARALFEMAFVRMGYAPAQRACASAIAERTGLWASPVHADARFAVDNFSIELAVRDLQTLLDDADLAVSPRADLQGFCQGAIDALRPTSFVPHVPKINEDAPAPEKAAVPTPTLRYVPPAVTARLAATAVPDTGRVLECCAALHSVLGGDRDLDRLDVLLSELKHEFVDVPPFEQFGAVGDLSRLAAACLAADLRDFLSRNRSLWYQPFGSAAMFFASARLDESGLGVYFANVSNIVRNYRDLFGLIRLARRGSPGADDLARWLPILTIHLPWSMREAVVDELGDLGLVRPLWAFLAVTVEQAFFHHDIGLLWRVRDAGLDIGEHALATAAQSLVAYWSVTNPIEWRVLSDIQAMAGRLMDAESSLQAGWSLNRSDQDFPARIIAIAAGDASLSHVSGGYGTSPMRRERRIKHYLVNRGITASDARS